MQKGIKVLYVCPFAHYTGHFPREAYSETKGLLQAGVYVELFTFGGVIGNAEIKVPQSTVRQHIRLRLPLYYLCDYLRKWKVTRRVSMLLETWLTLSVAITLKRKRQFDILHLRDGEPFPFLLHLMNFNLKGYKWLVSLTGTNLLTHPPLLSTLTKDIRLFVFIVLLRIVNCDLWKPVFKRSLSRNQFIFIVQNEVIKQKFESYMGGALMGKLEYVPLGYEMPDINISKEEARRYLGIPQNKLVFLSFGNQHVGKDIEVVFRAIKGVPDVFILQGGSVGWNNLTSANLAQKYGISERALIKDCYISEDDKPNYFLASDATILSYNKHFVSTTSLLWESCRFNIPVIASNNGQLKELVERFNQGLLFVAQDTDSLREAIMQFTKLKSEDVKTMKDNCQKFNKEFSIEKWAERCSANYDRLMREL